MIQRLEALNFRIFADIDQPLGPFQVLIGPNASGKSSFLDIVNFVGDVLRTDLHEAIAVRAAELRDLIHMRQDSRFELAVEMDIPQSLREQFLDGTTSTPQGARYEISVGYRPNGEYAILSETLFLKPGKDESEGRTDRDRREQPRQRSLFPAPPSPRPTLLLGRRKTPRGWRKAISRVEESGISYFVSERTGWNAPFRLPAHRATLASVPEDRDRFPATIWVRDFLQKGVQQLQFDIRAIRRPSRPGLPIELAADGSTLPWIVLNLKKNYKENFDAWLEHVRTVLRDLQDIDVLQHPEDRSAYLVLLYSNQLRVPSWSVSDGTLRLLALTLLAYLPHQDSVYLIEEPENGIHPRGVECVFQSLSSMTQGQVLIATHSPVVLNLATPTQILCFSKTAEGVADVVLGSEHPRLREWRGEVSLDTLYAAGVLG